VTPTTGVISNIADARIQANLCSPSGITGGSDTAPSPARGAA